MKILSPNSGFDAIFESFGLIFSIKRFDSAECTLFAISDCGMSGGCNPVINCNVVEEELPWRDHDDGNRIITLV